MALSKDSLRSQSVPHCLLLRGEGAGRADEVASLIFPSSVSRLRETRETPSPEGKAWITDCDRRESLERAAPVCATLRYDCHWQSLLF